MTYIANTGGLTPNSNGTSDFITLGPYLGNNGPVSYYIGFMVGKSSVPFAEIDLTVSTVTGFKALYNGMVVHNFSIPFVVGHKYSRKVMAMGSTLVFTVKDMNSNAPAETYQHPIASVAGKLTTAIDGIQWPGNQATPLPYAAVMSTFCHTRNYFMTCHIYNSTPDTTKRVSDTMTPVTMVTTEKGAGYTATSTKGTSSGVSPPISKPPPVQHPKTPQQSPQPSTNPSSPSIDTGLLILGGFIVIAIIGSVMFR